MWIKNARILTFDAANTVIDDGAVCMEGGVFTQVGRSAASRVADAFDARGMLLMPALINAHTHLYSTLARGMPLPGKAPRNFPEILKKLWWRLDRALKEEDVYYSALVGIIDSAKAGVGTLVDHHSSPNACAGSLDRVAQAFEEVGLRGCLCYETTDRNGAAQANAGIAENVRFIERVRRRPHPLLQSSFGLHASFTLKEATLRRAVEAGLGLNSGFHIHVAEDRCDVLDCRQRFGRTPVGRLVSEGVLADKSMAAHCVHVNAADIAALARHGVNVIHNPQSNSNNAVGTAKVAEMTKAGVLVGLGTDGYSPRLWEEFKAACHHQGSPQAYALAFLNNRQILKKIWGLDLGRIITGARADLVLLDYHPPTPMRSDNLFGHLLFGIAHASVRGLVVNGKFVVRDGICVNVDEAAVAERALAQARRLWERF